ncbi:MFS transporter [Bradyrhizobium macuxiense]|uniref:MFS transporter n=1 Tax=Bradyrhizobium macuxiense TaxID=1755647 RepID=A0A109JGA9_9BRAD|nr:MFS transporter [Bradyrhizobium macuxiense]KWV48443.1 MFS transporter [Bradyrhizobium macuxiense]
MHGAVTQIPNGIGASAERIDIASSAAMINARLDRLPMSWPIWKLVLMVALGAWFEIYDVFFTAYIGPGLVRSGIFTTSTVNFFGFAGLGAFVAAMFAGLFVGTLVFGQLADRFGRRVVFTGALLWYTTAAALLACQHSAEWIIFFRFLTGIGAGAEIVTIDSYTTELVPANSRGRSFAFLQAIQFSAVPTVALVAWYFVPAAPLGFDGWRWVIWLGCLGAVAVWFIRLGLPESPRWLAQQGRIAEADAIVSRLEREIVERTGSPLPEPEPYPPLAQEAKVTFAELWRSQYRGRTIMMLVFNFFQSIGYYGFASWVPTLLIAKGINITHSLLYSFVIAIANPIAPLLSMTFAERVERKWIVVGSAMSMAMIGIVFSKQVDAAVIVALGIAMAFASNCLTFSYRAYQAELFPTRMRSRAIGAVYSVSRISAMFSGFLIAFCLRDYGVTGVFALIAGAMAIVVATIGLFGPRTNGLKLDAVSG